MIVTREALESLTHEQLVELAVTQERLIQTQNELINLATAVIGKIDDRA